MKACVKPCNECPFRTDSLKGWLGPYHNPQELHNLVMFENPFPCHMVQKGSVDWDEVGSDENPLCAGALRYMKLGGKLPVNKELRDLMKALEPEDLIGILRNINELVKHHTV